MSAPLCLHLIALRRKSGISANVIQLYNDSCIKTFLMVHLLNTCSHDVSERGECRCFYVDFFFFRSVSQVSMVCMFHILL